MKPIRNMTLLAASTMILVHSVVLVQAQECPDYQDYLEWIPNATLSDRPTDIAVSGDHAFAAVNGLGLQVISIGDPFPPEVVGSVDTLPTAINVAVAGDLAYLLTLDAGLYIFDVSIPDVPSLMGSVALPSWSWEVAVSAPYAYVCAESGLFSVIDVSDPTSPEVVGSLSTSGATEGVAVDGNFAFVTHNFLGLLAVDIGDPINPFIAGSVGMPGSARKVAVSGGLAYVTNGNGVQVVDISNPVTPLLAGAVVTSNRAWDVAVSGSYAFVACMNHDPELQFGSMEIINITQASSPFVEGYLESTGNLSCMALTNSYALTNPGVYNMESGQIEGSLEMAWIRCGPVTEVPTLPGAASNPVMGQNIPNPFNPRTTITFELPKRKSVTLRVFDMSGHLVKNLITAEPHTPGRHEVVWNGRDDTGRQVASGTYFYRLEAGSFTETKRMVLVK